MSACSSPAERAAAAGAQAQQLLDGGRYREAVTQLDYALRERDDLPGLWLLLGRAKMALRDAPGAYAAYRNALDQDPSNREALFSLSQLSLAAGQYGEAEDYAGQVLLLTPGEPNALVLQAFAALGLGRAADAGRLAAEVLKNDPTSELGFTIKSMIAYRDGDYAEAASLLQESFRRDTNSIDVLRQLRRIYRKTADIRNMVIVTGRIARLQPDEINQLDYARSLYAAGDVARGGRVLQAMKPDTGATRRSAIVSMWMNGAVAPEMLNADGAIRGKKWVRLALAEMCNRMGRADLVLGILVDERATDVRIDNVDGQGALAAALFATGHRSEAIRRAQAVLAIEERQPWALLVRAWVAFDRKALDAALRDVRVVVADSPALTEGHELLAAIYRAQGEVSAADRAVVNASRNLSDEVDKLQYSVSYLTDRSKLGMVLSLTKDFVARNPLSRAGWKLRRDACASTGDTGCVTRATEFLGRLSGKSIDYSVDPEEGGASAAEEFFAS
jgi:tetratricopeptide (TPR) repeat protein